MKHGSTRLLRVALLLLCLPGSAFAQRELSWDAVSVAAHLNADGSLQVVETQAMVFAGAWNGGERTFNIRPHQKLSFDRISRWNGASWQVMTEDSSLDGVDDYALTGNTLRWRSRRPSDPPFNRTAIRYEIRYSLSAILLTDRDQYLLDHDFAFPDRAGVIDRFDLQLTLDPAWRPLADLRERYTETALAPGRSFVLKIPLRFAGAGLPETIDRGRLRAVRAAVTTILAFLVVSVLLFFAHEQLKGRFDPIETHQIDADWVREHLLPLPAELVSAAWDDSIGPPEVVALLARLTSEGKLESHPAGDTKQAGLRLTLKVNRSTFSGYERALIDKLFFGDRTTTSTSEVKSHYKKQGFNPADVIRKDLTARLRQTLPIALTHRVYALVTPLAFVAALLVLIGAWGAGEITGWAIVLLFIASGIIGALASIPGRGFRKRMERGYSAAATALSPAVIIVGGVLVFLLFVAGTGAIELADMTIAAIAALAIAVTSAAVHTLRSRQNAAGIAFRKRITAARMYFMSELLRVQPALRDDWYPWVLAFELDKEMADWSAHGSRTHRATTSSASSSTSSDSGSSSSSSSTWTGFGGGRSGGGGAGASWAAAAGGLAAGVAAPSSSSSSSSGGGGGGGGGGSSGGGGGGGW